MHPLIAAVLCAYLGSVSLWKFMYYGDLSLMVPVVTTSLIGYVGLYDAVHVYRMRFNNQVIISKSISIPNLPPEAITICAFMSLILDIVALITKMI